jgi:pseudouridylate synthase
MIFRRPSRGASDRTKHDCHARAEANQARARDLERRRTDPASPKVAETRDPGPVDADPKQKRERDRPQKHQKQAEHIAEPPHDPAPGSRARLFGDSKRLARPSRGKLQGAHARPGDRPGRRPVRFCGLWARPLGHTRVDGHRALTLDQTARDIIGDSSNDRVGRLAFGHQHPALTRVLEKSVGALIVRHVDERDHVEKEARMLALGQRQIKQVDALRRPVDDRLQRALKRFEADNLELAHLRDRIGALGVLDPSLPNRGDEIRLARDVLRLVVHRLVFCPLFRRERSANPPDRKLAEAPRDSAQIGAIDPEPRLPITLKRPIAAARDESEPAMSAADLMDFSPEVAEARSAKKPIVALESTIITHGMPYPRNVETARSVEDAAREMGAVPATIAVVDGRLRVGLEGQEIERLGQLSGGVVKASRRDLALVTARKGSAGTTVAATMFIAGLAGIEIFATGGIGGVHRGAEETFDISADLVELSRTRVAVVCAGAKSILDIGKTLEFLETQGVAVVGYRTDEFPAFFSRSSGFKLEHRCDGLRDLARMIRLQHDIGPGGLLIANPIPLDHALEEAAIEERIAEAVAEAKEQGVGKKEATPFLLKRVVELTEGKSLQANIALIKNNAMLAAQAAVELLKL